MAETWKLHEAEPTVRIGVHTPLQHASSDELIALWRWIDGAGFEWISVWDHFRPVTGKGSNLDAVAMHAALATVTRRVRVGCLVYNVGYRAPAVLASSIATVDQLSGGRAVLGLGAGYLAAEYAAYGFELEPAGTRVERLGSTLAAVRGLLSGAPVDHADAFVTLRGACTDPQPVQAELPIWVGGGGERRLLPLAGRLADGWNIPMATLADFARKSAIVDAGAIAAGRDPAAIARSVNLGLCRDPVDGPARFGPNWEVLRHSVLHGSADQMLEMLAGYGAAGADWVMLSVRPPLAAATEELAWFADEVLGRIAPTGAA